MSGSNRFAAVAVVAAAGAGTVFNQSAAADLGYSLDALAGYSDNIGRTHDNPKDDTLVGAGVQLQLAQSTAKTNATVAADLRYVDYTDNTFDSELVGVLKGSAQYALLPERLVWYLSDNFGQVRREETGPDNPANRENVNIMTTGPDLTLRFSHRMSVIVGGRYTNVYYEDSELDSDQTQENVSLQRDLSGASSVSLNVVANQASFDNRAFNDDYDRNEAFGKYELKGARTSLGIELGYSEVKGADFSTSGLLARVAVSRRISASSTLVLDGGQSYSDAARSFQQLQTLDTLHESTQPAQVAKGPFLSKFVPCRCRRCD